MTLTQTTPKVNPCPRLLSQVPAAIQDEVKSLLTKGTTYQPAYGPLRPNDLVGQAANGHMLQVNWSAATQTGSIGCLTCTREYEQSKGYTPGSVAKLVDNCPACYAAKIEMIARRVYRYDGPLFERETALPAPAVISPAAAIAAALKVEYPALSSRIDKALELVEANITTSQYETTVELANGGKPNRTCTCPDATYRNHRAEFGQACKHTIAAQIRYLLEQERRAVAARKLSDIIERDRARLQTNAAAYEFAGQPDALNRQKDNRRVYMGDKR